MHPRVLSGFACSALPVGSLVAQPASSLVAQPASSLAAGLRGSGC